MWKKNEKLSVKLQIIKCKYVVCVCLSVKSRGFAIIADFLWFRGILINGGRFTKWPTGSLGFES